ncbi:hypothetical protein FA95DRAFT_1553678 [Auriscalpium vulgare]|uniref:Uncharacterized protein n=1 Tax=Auriscalpium vulgare TaxID=40419 RepID=A0ACB8S838_9AGAM|nr:hypothetical protein FA95DRAFT_1553678 [Auriscalpium vulgare]
MAFREPAQPSPPRSPIRMPPASSAHPTALPPPLPGYIPHQNGAPAPPLPTPSAFRAPAHKHAHHLHSIPPREKSTRTLIIDHLLWAHARTRFAQARAELAMTDRTGGPSSSTYTKRERPETWDEDEEVVSEGEDADADALGARAGGPGHPHDEEEVERAARQDLPLARTLRLRAEGLEKVVTSMLDQPPQDHPFPSDEPIIAPAPTSPVRSAHPHTLPNGVRLRLALATVINDLFARQAPIPRHLQQRQSRSSSSTSGTVSDVPTPDPFGASSSSAGLASSLPPSLLALATVSNAGPSYAAYTSPSPQFTYQYPPPQPPPPAPHIPTVTTRTRDLFFAGADPTTANSPPSLRCPRHLHQGCEICVPAKGPAPSRPRVSIAKSPRIPAGVKQGNGLTGFKEGSGVGSGLARPGPSGSVLRRQVSASEEAGAGVSETSNSDAGTEREAEKRMNGNGNTRLGELIPRFMRLSALVAMELGREVGNGVGLDDVSEDEEPQPSSPSRRGATNGAPSSVGSTTSGRPLRPESTWYLLLAGLLTRAVLEGYLTAGWTGLTPILMLLGVGSGLGEQEGAVPQSKYERFEPDELPELVEAVQVLFPSLKTPAREGRREREGGEAEYEREMGARLARVRASSCRLDSLAAVTMCNVTIALVIVG